MKRILLFLLLSTLILSQNKKIEEEYSYGYSSSLNGTSQYMSRSPNIKMTGQYSLIDNFEDGNYTGWTVSSGSYAVNNSVANPLSSNQYSLVCNTAGIISIPCNQAYGVWKFQILKGADGNDLFVSFLSSANAFTNSGSSGLSNGYWFQYGNNERILLYKQNLGAAPNSQFYTNTSYISTNGIWYEIEIQHNTNGQFHTYITGGAFTTKTLVSVTGGSGSNPVTDNTYTSSNYFVLDLDAGDRIANIRCEYGIGSLDLNGYERILHSDNRGFETTGSITWAGAGNHSIAQSSTDKKTGTYSLAVTSSAAGDATTNYAQLPASAFVPIESGKKYTLEMWCRATNANAKVTLAIGSQSKQSTTLSTTSGSFTKVVWNFLATSSEVGQPIKMYVNQADVVYVDDVSLTQKRDWLCNAWINTTSNSGTRMLWSKSGTTYTELRSIGTAMNCAIGDGTYSVNLNGSGAYNNGGWHLITVLLNATGNMTIYNDGVGSTTTSISTLGKIINTSPFVIGSAPSPSFYWLGNIGEVQITTFDNIDNSNVNANTLLQAYWWGLPQWFGGNPDISGWWDFRGNSDSQFFRDKSKYGSNLTGTNVTRSGNQVRSLYPSKTN